MVYLVLGRGPLANKQSAIDFIGSLPQNEVLLPCLPFTVTVPKEKVYTCIQIKKGALGDQV